MKWGSIFAIFDIDMRPNGGNDAIMITSERKTICVDRVPDQPKNDVGKSCNLWDNRDCVGRADSDRWCELLKQLHGHAAVAPAVIFDAFSSS
jgi:hypothetical protein